MAAPISFPEVARAARRLYRQGPYLSRTMQQWRPYICPFHLLVNWVPPGARVLDIGCGSGLFLGLLAEFTEIELGLGFDASRSAIALAGQMWQNLRPEARHRLEFRNLDVAESWPDGEFDVVSLIDVLHHVPSEAQNALLEQAASKVAPGGILIYKDIAPKPRWRAMANRLHDLLVAHEWIHLRSFNMAASWLEHTQLRQIEYQRIDQWWYGHDLGIFQRPHAGIIPRPHRPLPGAIPRQDLNRRL